MSVEKGGIAKRVLPDHAVEVVVGDAQGRLVEVSVPGGVDVLQIEGDQVKRLLQQVVDKDGLDTLGGGGNVDETEQLSR